MNHFRVYLTVVALASTAYVAAVLRVHSLLVLPLLVAIVAVAAVALAVVVWCWERAGERQPVGGDVFADLHEIRAQMRPRTEAAERSAA